MDKFFSIMRVIADIRRRYMEQLKQVGALKQEHYHRYLSMQYHLTKDVQRYFYAAASHRDLHRMPQLRRFLVKFANEEELHYVVAGNDLRQMHLDVLSMPFDVKLWHLYFSAEVAIRPFVRLGAACVLENIAGPDNRAYLHSLLDAPFLNRQNTKFLVLHMHEVLPHGSQIVEAIQNAPLTPEHLTHLEQGAREGGAMYLRMTEWALAPLSTSALPDCTYRELLNAEDVSRIDKFEMAELRQGSADVHNA